MKDRIWERSDGQRRNDYVADILGRDPQGELTNQNRDLAGLAYLDDFVQKVCPACDEPDFDCECKMCKKCNEAAIYCACN